MKLQLPQVFGQRDGRWTSIILGNNTLTKYNIGLYGCLITCYGMYVNSQPNTVNSLLKNNGGFEAGNGNFIWGKSTVLGLNQIYVSPEYTGPVSSQGIVKIKELLDGGHPLICEIDFNPATEGEEMHFVLLMGYEGEQIYCADPWTGQILSLDVYGGPARAIVQFRAYDKTLPKETAQPSSLDTCMADREKFWKLSDQLQIENTELKKNAITLNDEMAKLNEQILVIKQEDINCAQKELEAEKQRDTIQAILMEIRQEVGFTTDDPKGLIWAVHELVGGKKDTEKKLSDLQDTFDKYKLNLVNSDKLEVIGTINILGYKFLITRG